MGRHFLSARTIEIRGRTGKSTSHCLRIPVCQTWTMKPDMAQDSIGTGWRSGLVTRLTVPVGLERTVNWPPTETAK